MHFVPLDKLSIQIYLGPKVWTENFESKLFERIMIETGLNRNAPELELLFLQMVKVFGQNSNARLKIA